MARLWIFSDLHQDWAGNAWNPVPPAAGVDIAVVAGDVHSPLTRSVDWLADRLAGMPVIYVPGNHDFWWDRGEDRYTMADQIARGRDLAARRNVHLLIDEAILLAGVRFLGSTLWTDLRLWTWSSSEADRMARRAMNDYRRIRRKSAGRDKYVRPLDLMSRHLTSRAWLDARLAEPGPGPSVVVTHHAPHPGSLPASWADTAHCYASDLSGLIAARQPALWVHGHVHSRSDYRLGATRVVCNPRGHVDEDSAGMFDSGFVVDLPAA